MITILSATNREGSMTRKVAEAYLQIAGQKELDARLFDLIAVPVHEAGDKVYRKGVSPMRVFGHSIFDRPGKFIIVSPEYNGSIPGILKLVLDCCDPEVFKGKRFALAGVSSGRAGNVRGMDHLTDILHYFQAEVYSMKQPISQVKNLVNAEKELVDESTLQVISRQIDGFMKF